MRDLFELGRPLGRRGLFQLVSDEALRDGKLEDWENEILSRLARFLKLEGDLARSIVRLSLSKYQGGQFDQSRPMDKVILYREILRHVHSDQEVDAKEQAMLDGMRQLLELSPADHDRLLAEIGRGASAPPVVSARLVELVAEVARRVEAMGSRPPDAGHLAKAQDLAKEVAAPTADCAHEYGHRVIAACGLSKILGRGGLWHELEEMFATLLPTGALSDESAIELGRAFTDLVDARISEGPLERVPTVLALAERLVALEPADDLRWVAVGAAGHQALRAFATARRFALVAKIVRILGGIPAGVAQAAGHHAEALCTWGILGMKAGEAREVESATTALGQLAVAAQHPEVVRARATLLGCAVEWWTSEAKQPEPARKALDSLYSVVRVHGADHGVATSFALASEFALMLLLILKDLKAVSSHLDRIKEVSAAHAGDEELQFALARSLVNSMVQVKGLTGVRTEARLELTNQLTGTLAALEAACPGSVKLADARSRLEKIKAQQASPDAGPVVLGPPPEDILMMRTFFEELQSADSPQSAIITGHMLMGMIAAGGYPRRVMDEGEEVYQTDEEYFLHLLKEMTYQIANDRSGYWESCLAKVEVMTRYMVEDATPAIATAARRLRTTLAMPAV